MEPVQKEVIISIQGRQVMPYIDYEDEINFVTAGRLYTEKGSYFVTYSESELTGLGGTTTTLMVEPKKVTLLRDGNVTTHLVFEQGRKHLSYYDSADASLIVGVSAQHLRSDFSETGGNIEVDYALEIDNTVTGNNNIKINVREA